MSENIRSRFPQRPPSKTITVRVNEELYKTVKALLQDRGNTFVEFLEASMKAFLEERANSTDNSRSDQRG